MTENLLGNDNDPVVDLNKDYLAELVGEGKKFKTVGDLARGKYEADMFIQAKNRQYDDLSEDYKKLREEYSAVPKLQELIDRLSEQNPPERDHTPSSDDNKTAIDPKEVQSLISSEIQKFNRTQKEDKNYDTVVNKLTEYFGENYKSILNGKAKDLGLSSQDVEALARNNPKLFFKTFDIEDKKNDTFMSPPLNRQRTDNFAPRTEKRTLSYYKELRKKNPNLYYDPKTVIQMDKDSQALGIEFFDV